MSPSDGSGSNRIPIHDPTADVRSSFIVFHETSLSIGKTFTATSTSETSKVRVPPAFGSAPLLMRGLAGAIVDHVTIQCQDQGRLLEEAIRDLEVFKKAYYKAEHDMRDREARFEQEKQALSDEIQQLKVRAFIYHIQT